MSAGLQSLIRWFGDIRLRDISLVGGKNASLGELYSRLSVAGVRVPNGFAVTADSYRNALAVPRAAKQHHRLLHGIDKSDVAQLEQRADAARKIVYEATASDVLREQVATAYRELECEYGSDVAVAVPSSATAEDLPNASFAGQHDSFLNIHGAAAANDACRRCFASSFLAELGVDSISVNPGSLARTIAIVRDAERSAGLGPAGG